MEPITIANELHDTGKQLRKGAQEIFAAAREKAESEKNYRVALAREIMTLRDKGLPVSIINDVARGNTADLKYSRDLSEAKYRASIEALDSLRSQSSALQTIIRYYRDLGEE